MKHVLVTGAGGFVCSNIVLSLAAQGYAVTAADRVFDPQLAVLFRQHNIQMITTDLSSMLDLHPDYLIHGAAITADPAEGENPEDHFRANVNPALKMLEWARDHQVKRFIFISSSAVFRGSTVSTLTETTPTTPNGLYAVAKHAVELLIQTLRQDYGRDVLAVRLGNIYGINEVTRATRPRVSLVGTLIQHALTEQHLSVPAASPSVDWTFAGDIGYALSALLQTPELPHALYHVTSGETLTALQIAHGLGQLLPGITVNTEANPVMFRGHMTPERLKMDTGFSSWTAFQDGLRQTVMWFKNQLEHAS